MRRDEDWLILTLPDQSTGVMHCETLTFYSLPGPIDSMREAHLVRPEIGTVATQRRQTNQVNIEVLAKKIESPNLSFAECFKRCGPQPRYSCRTLHPEVDLWLLRRIYNFKYERSSSMFSSADAEWGFLDGGIVSHEGYGWGSHSWTVVEGAESLRAICLFFGVKQPRQIAGESARRPLSVILAQMTKRNDELAGYL